MKKILSLFLAFTLVLSLVAFSACNNNADSEAAKQLAEEGIVNVYITTASGSMDSVHADKEHKEAGTIKVTDSKGAVLYDNNLDYIKGRGNNTWEDYKTHKLRPKLPYNIKLSESVDFLGLGKGKKFCLLADYLDHSHLRNKMMLDFAKEIGLTSTSSSRYCELYLNGEYNGLYLLAEKITVGKSRVNITDLEEATETANGGAITPVQQISGNNKWYTGFNDPENITGGYLMTLQTNRSDKYDCGFTIEADWATRCVEIASPEYASTAQFNYISNFVKQAENSLYYGEENAWENYFDIDSWVKKYFVEMISGNYDHGYASQWFYKEANDNKLYAGPAWDYDLSMGSLNGAGNLRWGATEFQPSWWFSALVYKSAFKSRCGEIYSSVIKDKLEKLVDGGIDDYYNVIKDAVKKDAKKYGYTDYDKEVNSIKTFMAGKFNYLETNNGVINYEA